MTDYLTSTAWFRRRDQWFALELARAGKLECGVCMKPSRKRELELHHLDYTGVQQLPNGRWVAGEKHEDLVCLHPRCHEWVHQALDNDPASGAAITRRVANERVIARLRNKIIGYLGGLR
ncbi:hypothetical protein ACFC14_18785 [Microbacterium sp. NPDC055988]|uniref:hypothetical protein n=1 Tax=Microbacterium sp. NPDC055988 TaxID=3345671 RepID=UPI0035DC81D2